MISKTDGPKILDYCTKLATGRSVILDLGCGTGLLAASLAREGDRFVVGVDPAGPVLEIARRRLGGRWVRWLRDDAGSVRLGQRFDLVLLTGYAFQVFLTQEDQSAVLRTGTVAKVLTGIQSPQRPNGKWPRLVNQSHLLWSANNLCATARRVMHLNSEPAARSRKTLGKPRLSPRAR